MAISLTRSKREFSTKSQTNSLGPGHYLVQSNTTPIL